MWVTLEPLLSRISVPWTQALWYWGSQSDSSHCNAISRWPFFDIFWKHSLWSIISEAAKSCNCPDPLRTMERVSRQRLCNAASSGPGWCRQVGMRAESAMLYAQSMWQLLTLILNIPTTNSINYQPHWQLTHFKSKHFPNSYFTLALTLVNGSIRQGYILQLRDPEKLTYSIRIWVWNKVKFYYFKLMPERYDLWTLLKEIFYF